MGRQIGIEIGKFGFARAENPQPAAANHAWLLSAAARTIPKLRAFSRLPTPCKHMVLKALILHSLIWPGLRLMGVARTQRWLKYWLRRPPNAVHFRNADRVIALCLRAQYLVEKNTWPGTCLVRSLTLWSLLLQLGLETDIRVGFRKISGKIEAHAWVEYAGKPLNEYAKIVGSYTEWNSQPPFFLWP